MLRIKQSILALFACAAFSSCATIINGSTQKVFIVAPPGTLISDTSGKLISMTRQDYNENSITLKRNRDYTLRFRNNDQELTTTLPRSIGAGWVVFDLLLDIVPIFVDWGTGDWYPFDNLKITFPLESTKSISHQELYVESYERAYGEPPIVRRKIGGIFIIGAGVVGPINDVPLIFNGYEIGMGYTIFPRVDAIVMGIAAFIVAFSPYRTDHSSQSSSLGLSLETRYTAPSGLYAAAGGGWLHVNSDSIKYSESFFDSSSHSNSSRRAVFRRSPLRHMQMDINVLVKIFVQMQLLSSRANIAHCCSR